MTTKFGSVELPVEADTEFRYVSTLTIDPPLSAAEIKKVGALGYLTTEQVSDEDVRLVDGQIVVVSEKVTRFPGQHVYGVAGIQALYADLEKIGNAAGRALQGDVIICFHYEEDEGQWPVICRFVIGSAGKVLCELARLYWPSNSTTTPIPTS